MNFSPACLKRRCRKAKSSPKSPSRAAAAGLRQVSQSRFALRARRRLRSSVHQFGARSRDGRRALRLSRARDRTSAGQQFYAGVRGRVAIASNGSTPTFSHSANYPRPSRHIMASARLLQHSASRRDPLYFAHEPARRRSAAIRDPLDGGQRNVGVATVTRTWARRRGRREA